MFGIEALSGWLYAAVVVSLVLVEAIVLHKGYDFLTEVVGEKFKTVLRGE